MKIKCSLGLIFLSIFPFLGIAQQSGQFPFNQTNLPLETRLQDLIKRLTIDEKIGMLSETSLPVERLGVDKYYYGNEGLHGGNAPWKIYGFSPVYWYGCILESCPDQSGCNSNIRRGPGQME